MNGTRLLPGIYDLTLAGYVYHYIVGEGLIFTLLQAALAAGNISPEEALALGSVNVERLLGVDGDSYGDLVATRGGGLLDFSGKVIAVISPRRGLVDIL